MRKLMAIIGLGVMLLGACGGGSDNKTENASAGSDTTEAASSGDFSDVCAAKAGFAAPNAQQFAAGNMKETFKNIKEGLDTAKSKAPSEIKADVVLLVDTSKPYFELLAAHNYDFMAMAQDPSTQEQLQELSAKFQEEKVQAAQQRVQAWADAHCN